MTTTHSIVFHVRCVEANEAPVSLGIYATIEGARADVQAQLDPPEDLLGVQIPWISETVGFDGPDGNWFQACFQSALDECNTNPEQCDVSGEVDFLTVSDDGCTVAVWWIEAVAVKP